MFRKAILAAASLAALGAATLAPTAASAGHWGFHHGGPHWHGHHHWRPPVVSYYVEPGCYVKRRVWTHHGWRWRSFNVCD